MYLDWQPDITAGDYHWALSPVITDSRYMMFSKYRIETAIADMVKWKKFFQASIVGLVVEFVVAIDEARVRFTDDAFLFFLLGFLFLPLSPFFLRAVFFVITYLRLRFFLFYFIIDNDKRL